MSFVRIRLTFQRHLPLAEVKNCWFLVDTSTCSTIADLEYLIKKRFKALAKSCNSVDLFLDDFLLPSQEKIEIIQNNDNIRVELKQMILNQESRDEATDDQATEKKLKRKKGERSSPDASKKSKQKKVDGSAEVLNQTKKKRKKLSEKDFLNGDTTKTHSKKAKKEKSSSQANKNQVKEKKIEKAVHNKHKSNIRTVTANEDSSLLAQEERKSILALPSTSTFKAQLTKTSKHSKGKSVKSSQSLSSTSDAGKRKNTLELLQTNSKRSKANASEKDKDIVTGKTAADSDSSSSESSSSTESSSESTDESGPSNSPFKVNDMASPVASAAVINSNKSPLHKRLGKDVQHKTSTESVSVKLSNGKEGKVETGKGLKSSLVAPGNSKGNGTARLSTSLSLSSSDLSIDANKSKDAITQDAQFSSSSSSLSSPSLEETNLEKSKKMSSSLLHPLPSSSPSLLSSPSILRRIQMDTTDESSVNQSMISIIERSNPLGLKHAQQSSSRRQNKKQDSNFSTSHIRFDSEESEEETTEEQQDISSRMNITNDLNSTQSSSSTVARKQNHQTKSEGAVSKFKEPAKRDYSICTPLHGPPRSGDKIAYKVLELSASYTPEVSSYKEGTVLNFDPSSGAINVELAKESLKRARGDGNVTGKFELVYDESEENVEEEFPEVVTTVLWNAMIDPVLIE